MVCTLCVLVLGIERERSSIRYRFKKKNGRYIRFRYLIRYHTSKLSFSICTKKHGDVRGWRAKHVRYFDVLKVSIPYPIYRKFDISKFSISNTRVCTMRKRGLYCQTDEFQSRFFIMCISRQWGNVQKTPSDASSTENISFRSFGVLLPPLLRSNSAPKLVSRGALS